MIINNYETSKSSIPGQILEGAVIIPEEIVVHIGQPDELSENIKVPFIDYIKNVASSELYPTWHENALRANINAIVSVTLNRYFTDWYRSRGYDFDITSSTQFDQAYYPERGTFENINKLVDETFNQYIVREGRIEPFYARFCDGKISKCQGLYQWGSVDMANEGYSPLEILQYYYDDNISIKSAFIEESIYRFEEPLKLGDSGLDVLRKELQLDRISENFPAIPKIVPIDGYYDETTEAAVKVFHKVFNLPVTGIIDKSTWYKVTNITTAVKKLAETTSEVVLLKRFEEILSGVLLEGDIRPRVSLLQYLLVVISLYFPTVPEIAITGVFDNQTRLAVIEYQKIMNLRPTGLVDSETWESIYNQARGILSSLPVKKIYIPFIRYPKDYALGDHGPGVFVIQEMLKYISNIIPQISYIESTQIFDEATKNSVISFQNYFNLERTGIVNKETWNKISEIYRAQRYSGVNTDEISILN